MLKLPWDTANYRPITAKNLYTIYYGWLIADPEGTPNQEAYAIAAARPELLIAFFYTFEPKYTNLSEQVRKLMANAGVRLFAYVDTDYGRRDLEAVRAEVNEYLAQDVAGIFFDQVYNFLDNSRLSYYQEISSMVRSHTKAFIFNTGIAQPGEEIMNVTDIMMVEHDWRKLYQANSWFAKYPPERFMGNSSNEHPGLYFDQPINADIAVRDTMEAWANGVGWHFSTDRYISLPVWFSEYAAKLREEHPK
jgi:hypothetical protein